MRGTSPSALSGGGDTWKRASPGRSRRGNVHRCPLKPFIAEPESARARPLRPGRDRSRPLLLFEKASPTQKPGGYGVLTADAPWIHREGVLAHLPSATDLLFITLRKCKALFSPSTCYRDLALGPSLFHWESKSTITASSATGQRYIHHEASGRWRSAGGWSGRSRRFGCR